MPTKVRSPEIYVTLRGENLSEVMQDTGTTPEAESGGKIVSFVACEETPVERWDWFKGRYFLIFSHDPEHVRLDRVRSGACMFIEDHDTYEAEKRIGKVVSAAIDNKQLKVEVRLNSLEAGQRFYQEILDKTEPPKSIGAAVYETEVVEPALYEEDEDGIKKQIRPATLRAIDWELMEISAVTVPAVPNAATKEASCDREYETLMHGDPGMELNIPEIVVKAESQTKTKPKQSKPKKPTYPKGKPMKTNLRDEFLSLEQEDLVDRAIELHRQNESLKTQQEDLQTEVEALKRKDEIRDQYFSLRNKAENLLRQTKLSAHRFGKYFSDSSVNDVAKLCKDDAAKVRLLAIEMFLDDIEENGVAQLNTELKTDAEPLPKSEPKTETLKTPTGEDVETYAQNMISRLFK